jgi:protein TonB
MLLLLLGAQFNPGQAAPARGPIAALFTDRDYPREARKDRLQGVVLPKFTVGTNGRVTDCKIVQSSGYKILDDATCNILMKRGRFTPARDSLGRVTIGVITGPPITWRYSP